MYHVHRKKNYSDFGEECPQQRREAKLRSLISSFTDLRSRLPEAKALLLKESERATCPRTHHRTQELTPRTTTTSEKETRTVRLQQPTLHRLNLLPAATYVDNRLRVLSDDKTFLLQHAIKDNAATTGGRAEGETHMEESPPPPC